MFERFFGWLKGDRSTPSISVLSDAASSENIMERIQFAIYFRKRDVLRVMTQCFSGQSHFKSN